MENSTLKGKTVVITGGTSGIGRAAAEAFALEGCHIIIGARGQDALDETVQLCRDLGVIALGVSTDVSDAAQVQYLAETALQYNGRIDIWVNNAGVMATGKLEDMPAEVIEQIVRTNLLGYLHGARTVLPIFKKQGDGVLLNNISVGGWMPAPYGTAYSASKFGVRGMVETLQGEVSDYPDIHICGLYPGIQRSTGNMHSAKYSGFSAKIPPLSFDPRELAATMVQMAKNPKKEVYPDWSGYVFKKLYGLFPKTIINAATAGMRLMMSIQNRPETNGNVMAPSSEPHRIYGETMLPVPSSQTKKMALATLLGVSAYLIYQGSKKD